MEGLVSAYCSSSSSQEEDVDEERLLHNHQKSGYKNDETSLVDDEEVADDATVRRDIGPKQPFPSLPDYGPQLPDRPLPSERERALPNSSSLPVVGRYVSKRERALVTDSLSEAASSAPVNISPGLPTVLNADLPLHVQKRLKRSKLGGTLCYQLPKGLLVRLEGHTRPANAVRWSPTHACLLASAGMDAVSNIWNIWNEEKQQRTRTLSTHTSAIKDIQWSLDGNCVLTCGFDQTSRLYDVETGCEKQVFKDDQIVTVVKFYPFKGELFLSGGSKGALRLWDVRTGKIVQEYLKGLGHVMDVDYSLDGRQFVSTSDITQRNASDKTIVVWDFHTQIPLSHQVYLEAYTCPCVRYHPYDDVFIAQSNANYIAMFSGHPPFKMNKYKRFEGHQVAGYRVQCNFSPDGEILASGSANGCLYFYHYKSSRILKILAASQHVCMDVSFNPMLSSTVACCCWDGTLLVFE